LKTSIHMITLNDEAYVWWALKSTYPAVDHICIVEGAITHAVHGEKYISVPASAQGLSLDGTRSEIQRFIENDDPEKKVQYEPVGFVDNWEDLRNKAHQLLPKDTKIVLLQDGDCLYKPDEIERAKNILRNNPEIFEIALRHRMFFGDLGHVLDFGKRVHKFWRWNFYRYNPSMYYLKERSLRFADGFTTERRHAEWSVFREKKDQFKGLQNVVIYDENLLNVYHFGYVQERERMEIQLMRKIFSDSVFKRMNLPDRKRETLMTWLRMYHKIYTGVLDAPHLEFVVPFEGTYPLDGLIQNHPYFGKPPEWFRHNDEEGNPNSPFYGKEWWSSTTLC
jgi:hypothetical protein